MRRWLEGLETFAIDVILERRYGRRADVLRWILHGLAAIYRVIVQIRLALYRNRYFRPRSLGCVVISVGNLTVGGTGKTPVVEMLARALASGRPTRRDSQPRLQERSAPAALEGMGCDLSKKGRLCAAGRLGWKFAPLGLPNLRGRALHAGQQFARALSCLWIPTA